MDEINALSDDSLTTEGSEEDNQTTDNTSEGETSPAKGIEPPDGTKNWQQALQQAREREKREKSRAAELEAQLGQVTSRINELELQGLDETERLRVEAQQAKSEAERYKQEIEVENVKKEYRAYLAEREADNPRTIAFLRKQADKDIYPVQGKTREDFDTNFDDFAQEFEEAKVTSGKPAASNPAYQSPAEVDLASLSSAELQKILPRTDKE